jgi:uncharacterized protein (DUF362 family)
MENEVIKVKFEGNLKKAIEKAIEKLGGLCKFVSPNDKVLLKPNFITQDPYPATTSLDFLEKLIEILFEKGKVEEIIIGESSAWHLETKKVMENLGIFSLALKFKNLKIIPFEECGWERVRVFKGKYLKEVSLPKILKEVSKIILLPCLKTHSQTFFTLSLKLAMGFLPPEDKEMFHKDHLEEKIAELNTLFKPTLIIIDARKCFVSGGPDKGEIREPNLILASKNRVALDVEGIKILKRYGATNFLNKDPLEFLQIKRAIELKIDI